MVGAIASIKLKNLFIIFTVAIMGGCLCDALHNQTALEQQLEELKIEMRHLETEYNLCVDQLALEQETKQ